MLYTMPTRRYSNSSSIGEICLRGKTRTAGESASVTDEKPALPRRAVLIWWIKVCHLYPLLRFGQPRGDYRTMRALCCSPLTCMVAYGWLL